MTEMTTFEIRSLIHQALGELYELDDDLASVLWDDVNPQRARKLDKIIEELGDILYQEDT